jgi:hypothetical protein
MLNVLCEEYLAAVRKKADELGLGGKLERRLEYLATYACNNDPPDPEYTLCYLRQYRAPLSFEFTMHRKLKGGEYSVWFNGGLIFHTPGSGGAGAPEFSVRIGECSEADWSVHT